jgi:hypothetical protein
MQARNKVVPVFGLKPYDIVELSHKIGVVDTQVLVQWFK